MKEFELDKDESKTLGDAVANVSKVYGKTFDPRKVAVAELIICAGGIYSTRFAAYKIRKELEKQNPIQVAAVTVDEKQKVNGVDKSPRGYAPSDIMFEPARDHNE